MARTPLGRLIAGRRPAWLLGILGVCALALAAALLGLLPADPALAQDDAARPAITAGPTITSSPESGDAYGKGEEIVVSVTFSEAVTVTVDQDTGGPRLRLDVGDRHRWARYDRSDENDARLIFTYTINGGDTDGDGVSIRRNSLKLAGGAIEDAGGNPARLKHPALPDQAGHQVDGAPRITAGPVITSNPKSGDAYGKGEKIVVAFTFSEPVTVTGEPRLRLTIGEKKRWAKNNRSGKKGARLFFSYKVKSADGDADGVSIQKNAIDPNGGTIQDADGNRVRLRHAARPDQAGHQVDGAPGEPEPEPTPTPTPAPEPEPTATPTPPPANNEPQFAGESTGRSVAENSAAGQSVGNPVTATDGDDEDLTYALTGSNDFAIDDSGQIRVASGATLDYETQAEYVVTVSVTDSKDAAGAAEAIPTNDDTITVTIAVTNVDEAGTVTFGSAAPQEGTALTATLSDPDGGVTGAVTWAWTSATASDGTFAAAGTATGSALVSTYTPVAADVGKWLRATASYADGEGSGKNAQATTAATVIAAANAAPAFTSSAAANAAENQTEVITVEAADSDSADSITGYAISGGADRAKFSIVPATGVLTFQTAPDFEDRQDAGADNVYNVTVQATGGAGTRVRTATQDIVVTVTNVDEAGTVTFGSAAPQEGTPLTAELADPDVVQSSPAVTWAWERLAGANASSGTSISGATSAGYTPVAADVGKWLRATASYADGEGSGKSAQATTAAAVIATVTGQPALRFTQTEYRLHPKTFIWYDNMPRSRQIKYGNASPTMPIAFFDQIVVEARSEIPPEMEYAVEGLPDISKHQFCGPVPPIARKCIDLGIGVGEETGFLFAKVYEPCKACGAHYTNDYPTQRMELSVSAEEDAPGLKVYREVLVKPSDSAPDCSDFPNKDVDRFTCLFLGEMLPDELPATTAALRNGLPNLVQPKANYDLIFAEEFNGTLGQELPTEGCHNGLATLDNDLWNYWDRCPEAYPDTGVPCVNIEDGHFYMARTSWCDGGMNSTGSFDYKYGYLEVKYTVDAGRAHPFFHNLAFHVGDAGSPGRIELQTYNVPMNDYEDLSKHVETELDIFEYIPRSKWDIFHQYGNWYENVMSREAAPRRSVKIYAYCGGSRYAYSIAFSPPSCAQQKVTVTKGIEWTPRGYRSFVKVDGVHDKLVTLLKKNIWVERKVVSGRGNNLSYGHLRALYGSARDAFFEHLEAGKTESVLEQVAIAHRPLSLWLNGWGYASCNPGESPPCDKHPEILTKMEVDYIRVYQPKDRYMDMEPVYK